MPKGSAGTAGKGRAAAAWRARRVDGRVLKKTECACERGHSCRVTDAASEAIYHKTLAGGRLFLGLRTDRLRDEPYDSILLRNSEVEDHLAPFCRYLKIRLLFM